MTVKPLKTVKVEGVTQGSGKGTTESSHLNILSKGVLRQLDIAKTIIYSNA